MELITQKIEILFEYRPTSFQEGPIEAIRTWGAVRWHGRHNIINFLICERSHKIGEDLFIFEQVIQVKFHGQRVSLSHPSLEVLKQDRFFSSMIIHNLAVRIFKRTDAVSPITFCRDSLRKTWSSHLQTESNEWCSVFSSSLFDIEGASEGVF